MRAPSISAAAILIAVVLSPLVAGAQTPIACGESISSSISSLGEVDEYSFSASAGDVVLVSISNADANPLDERVTLVSPTSSPIPVRRTSIKNTILVRPTNRRRPL